MGSTYSLRTGYAYDDAGQLTVAWVTNSAGSLVGGESRGYGYDFAQNLSRRTNSAGGSPVNAHANHLNQITNGLSFNSYTHDRRGNLTFADAGSWAHAFAYDHENQCTSAGGYYGPYKSEYVYDGRGRLRKRTDWSWTGSSWYPNGEVRYLYDGMRLIQERTSANHPAVTYTRGSDLSGSLEGAGGIGGLLARTVHSATTPYQPSSHAFYHADGNGNVTYLLKSDRTHGASYKYDPYGRLITSSGTFASVNTMRFSSKEWHAAASLYYYGYRFYVPELQRWLNRDPLAQGTGALRGVPFLINGISEYGFNRNSPTQAIDPDGRLSLVISIVAGYGLWTSYCLTVAISEAEDRYDKTADSDPEFDKKKHCYTSCRFNRCMLGQTTVTLFGGVVHEVITFSSAANSREDLAANLYGLGASFMLWEHCGPLCDTYCP